MSDETLSNLMHEDRRFPPPPDLAAAGERDGGDGYARRRPTPRPSGPSRRKRLSWVTEPQQVLDWSKAPFATWFADGTLNAAYNCLDRHVEAG